MRLGNDSPTKPGRVAYALFPFVSNPATTQGAHEHQPEKCIMARITNLAVVRQSRANMSLGQYAESLGRKDAGDIKKTLESTLPFHEAYHTKIEGETGEQYMARRNEMRETWITRYVKGRCGVSEAEARKIMNMTRAKRVAKNREWELAVNTASKGFNTHVVRPEGSGSNGKGSEPVAIPRGFKGALNTLVKEYFEGDFDTFLKAARQCKPE